MIRIAIRDAWSLYIRRFGKLMLNQLMMTALLLICLTPAMVLVTGQTWLPAAICAVLLLLVFLPARLGEADFLRHLQHDPHAPLVTALTDHSYGTRLGRGARSLGLLLLWALPLMAATAALLYVYFAKTEAGGTDTFTLIMRVSSLGGGDLIRGALLVLGAYAALLLPLSLGFALHSGDRHAFAATGSVRLLKGRRGGLVVLWLLALLIFLPFAAAAGLAVRYALHGFSTTFSLPSMQPCLLPLCLTGAAAYLLLPLKTLLPMTYVAALQGDDHAA